MSFGEGGKLAEAEFASFLEAVPEAMLGVDEHGQILMANAEAAAVFGYSKDELIGQATDLLLVGPVGAEVGEDQQLAAFRAYFFGPEPRSTQKVEMERILRRKDGGQFPAEVVISRVDSEERRIIVVALRDVSERRRAESKFRGLLETAPDAIVGVDAAGVISLVNTQAEALFGYSREELLGQTVEMLVPMGLRERHIEHRQEYFKDPKTRSMGAGMVLAGRRKDGFEFPVEISLSAIETEEGLLATAVIRDVSERIRVQREHDRLEALHEHDRLERQLHQSQRLESLGQLAGGVAHDFNNLLAAILNFVNFAGESLERQVNRSQGADQEELAGALADVRQIGAAAERAARLTHQLLAFSRREVIQPEVLQLNEIVHEVENLLRRSIGEHVAFLTEYGEELWPVYMDRGQLEQVLLNVAVNARDAMKGGGRLTIQTGNVEIGADYAARQVELQEGQYVRLRVTDTGMGMAPEIITHAFEPFFTTKPKEEGSGLGLATVYGIVAQAGGAVNLYSEVGMGTTVTIFLPRAGGMVKEGVATELRLPRRGGETILVVEDEELVREVARRILTRNGYTVLVASGGEEALAVVAQKGEEIQLLLSDVVMPGMPGNELAQEIQRRHPDIKVLFMSGYPESVISAQGVVQAGIRLISKPFVEPELLESVREVLDE